MSMWNRTAETMSRDEYAAVQLKGLKKSLARAWANDFYRERMKTPNKEPARFAGVLENTACFEYPATERIETKCGRFYDS